jgi:hypothetical protein
MESDITLHAGNTGMGIGIIHYINFPTRQNVTVIPDTYFNDHFKLRSELSYNKTNLDLGQWVAPDKTRLGADQLRL